LLSIVFLVAGCQVALNPPDAALEPTGAEATQLPAEQAVKQPAAQLAYLRDGNVWQYDFDTQTESPITEAGSLLAFAWSPDGSQIATYDGRLLCLIALSGPEQRQSCHDLVAAGQEFGLRGPEIVWSPDQSHLLVIDNGWWVVDLVRPDAAYHIVEPVDWGWQWADDLLPSGGWGMMSAAAFLPDGSLVGTVTHSTLCGSGGCLYEIATLDLATQRLAPAELPDVTEVTGGAIGLSPNGRFLVNFGLSSAGCAIYATNVLLIDLRDNDRHHFRFDQEAFYDLTLARDGRVTLIAQGEGCNLAGENVWSVRCGLSDHFEIYPMQLWMWDEEERIDLPPGLEPAWSPGEESIAFRSCLAQAPNGKWEPIAADPPWIYVLHFADDTFALEPVAVGQSPAWRP
jgi:hypothetical protein